MGRGGTSERLPIAPARARRPDDAQTAQWTEHLRSRLPYDAPVLFPGTSAPVDPRNNHWRWVGLPDVSAHIERYALVTPFGAGAASRLDFVADIEQAVETVASSASRPEPIPSVIDLEDDISVVGLWGELVSTLAPRPRAQRTRAQRARALVQRYPHLAGEPQLDGEKRVVAVFEGPSGGTALMGWLFEPRPEQYRSMADRPNALLGLYDLGDPVGLRRLHVRYRARVTFTGGDAAEATHDIA